MKCLRVRSLSTSVVWSSSSKRGGAFKRFVVYYKNFDALVLVLKMWLRGCCLFVWKLLWCKDNNTNWWRFALQMTSEDLLWLRETFDFCFKERMFFVVAYQIKGFHQTWKLKRFCFFFGKSFRFFPVCFRCFSCLSFLQVLHGVLLLPVICVSFKPFPIARDRSALLVLNLKGTKTLVRYQLT